MRACKLFYADTHNRKHAEVAGPVVVASCCIRKPFSSFLTKASSSAEDLIVSQSEAEVLALVNDCKELTSETRRTVHEIAMGNPEVFATTVAVRSARAIDEMNLNRATQEAFAESIETLVEMHSLPQGETYAIVDGKISPKLYAARRIQSDDPNAEQFTTFPVRPYVNGDGNVYCVALASIIARVERERLMFELAVEHPEYGFADHNGYGRKDHLEVLHRPGLPVLNYNESNEYCLTRKQGALCDRASSWSRVMESSKRHVVDGRDGVSAGARGVASAPQIEGRQTRQLHNYYNRQSKRPRTLDRKTMGDIPPAITTAHLLLRGLVPSLLGCPVGEETGGGGGGVRASAFQMTYRKDLPKLGVEGGGLTGKVSWNLGKRHGTDNAALSLPRDDDEGRPRRSASRARSSTPPLEAAANRLNLRVSGGDEVRLRQRGRRRGEARVDGPGRGTGRRTGQAGQEGEEGRGRGGGRRGLPPASVGRIESGGSTMSLALLHGPTLLPLSELGRLEILRSDPRAESGIVCNKRKCEVSIKFAVYPAGDGGGAAVGTSPVPDSVDTREAMSKEIRAGEGLALQDAAVARAMARVSTSDPPESAAAKSQDGG
ncbi:hypothetical protein THAOC_01600, partial [Thalassiosira oceanica]